MKKRGEWLKARREELKKLDKLKFSVRAVAERVGITGAGLSHLENSDAMPALDLALKLAKELDRPVEWILTGIGGDDFRGIPVIGTTSTGPDMDMINSSLALTCSEYVDIDVRDHSLYGLKVDNDPSLASYHVGEVLVAAPNGEPVTGEDVVVVTKSGQGPFVKMLASQRDGKVYLDSPGDRSQRVIIDLDEIICLHPVVCVAKSIALRTR
ncbi:helix-turn-helix domain-containing protein [Atlantibacter hermannii]|uniref:helix-turn-helix transcriptional regulator n=1 Tax=Atlantibacter hermannii TaxID=565 RepID=UPI0028A04C4D|nr:helix-turn-helix transcriptional regulator [Atlantibacter hermannii]MEB7926149.1 helix-turn-helix domain-containing protein [Atlantibacter hermannii]